MDKIKQFPNCVSLLYTTAMILNGTRLEKRNQEESFRNIIISLYERVVDSDDYQYCNRAKESLAQFYMQEKDYEKAEDYIAQITQVHPIDIKQLQARLYCCKHQFQEAQHLQEESLLKVGNDAYQIMMRLLEIALKDGRMEDAQYIANATSACAKVFDQWEYNTYVPKFEYYTKSKQKVNSVKVLIPMLKSLRKPWNINASPLYRTIKTKESTDFFSTLESKIVSEVMEDEETAFMKEDVEFQAYVKTLQKESK